jgi:hypothetical protein
MFQGFFKVTDRSDFFIINAGDDESFFDSGLVLQDTTVQFLDNDPTFQALLFSLVLTEGLK